jgi:hypothetical protein
MTIVLHPSRPLLALSSENGHQVFNVSSEPVLINTAQVGPNNSFLVAGGGGALWVAHYLEAAPSLESPIVLSKYDWDSLKTSSGFRIDHSVLAEAAFREHSAFFRRIPGFMAPPEDFKYRLAVWLQSFDVSPDPGLFTAATGARESPDPKTQFWPLAPFATA